MSGPFPSACSTSPRRCTTPDRGTRSLWRGLRLALWLPALALLTSGCSLLDPGLVQVRLAEMKPQGTRCLGFVDVENTTAERLERLTFTLTWVQAGRHFNGRFVDRQTRFVVGAVRADGVLAGQSAQHPLPDACHVYGAEPVLSIDACQMRNHDERSCIARIRFTDARSIDDPSLIMAIPE